VLSRRSLRRPGMRRGSRSKPSTDRQRLAHTTLSGCNSCAQSRIPRRFGSSSANSPASRSGRKCSGFAIAYVDDRKTDDVRKIQKEHPGDGIQSQRRSLRVSVPFNGGGFRATILSWAGSCQVRECHCSAIRCATPSHRLYRGPICRSLLVRCLHRVPFRRNS
jgi:hypothetical protein